MFGLNTAPNMLASLYIYTMWSFSEKEEKGVEDKKEGETEQDPAESKADAEQPLDAEEGAEESEESESDD